MWKLEFCLFPFVCCYYVRIYIHTDFLLQTAIFFSVFKYVYYDNAYVFEMEMVFQCCIRQSYGVIYTYEDVELRRIFAGEFPQDTIRKSGTLDSEHLGRYIELKNYFKNPKTKINSHFEELTCHNKDEGKICKVDTDRYSPEEDQYYMSLNMESHVDRRRVFCFMLLCFTEDELDRVVASF